MSSDTFVRSVRQRVLNENNSKKFWWTDAIQSGLFAALFATGEMVIASTASAILFPTVALFSLYKTYYFDWKNYKHEKNKNIIKKASLAINVLNTTAEVIAVSAGVAAYFGTQLLALPIISALFMGAVGGRFLSHFAQTIYHGYQWASADTNTKKNEKHKAQFWSHLRATATLAVVGSVIGLLMFTPAFHLLTLSAGAVIAVKAVGATLLSCNLAKLTHSVYESHQQKKRDNKAWRMKCGEAQTKRREVRAELEKKCRPMLDEISPGQSIESLIPQFIEQEPKFIGEPLPHDKTRADFGGNIRLRFKYKTKNFQSLKDHDVDDLIRTLEASDEDLKPKQTLLALLQQSSDALLKDLGLDPKTDVAKLNENGQLAINEKKDRGFFSCLQRATRLDKLHAVLLLTEFVKNDGKNIICIKEKNTVNELYTIFDLIRYLKQNKKLGNVFHSFMLNGNVQKLFALTDYYLKHRDLHPDSRLSYENRRLMYASPAA